MTTIKRVYPEDVAAKEKESLMETLQEAEDTITKPLPVEMT